MRWLDGITNSMDMSFRKFWETDGPGSQACFSPRGCNEFNMTELNDSKVPGGLKLGMDSPARLLLSCSIPSLF